MFKTLTEHVALTVIERAMPQLRALLCANHTASAYLVVGKPERSDTRIVAELMLGNDIHGVWDAESLARVRELVHITCTRRRRCWEDGKLLPIGERITSRTRPGLTFLHTKTPPFVVATLGSTPATNQAISFTVGTACMQEMGIIT